MTPMHSAHSGRKPPSEGAPSSVARPNREGVRAVGINDGRVAVVTGAGGGIGRAEAMTLAAEGARVVVNDLGGSVSGEGSSAGPAQQVVDEIVAAGGEAVANTDDISDYDGAGRLVHTAIATFGGLDVVVCNAGILRDRMLV